MLTLEKMREALMQGDIKASSSLSGREGERLAVECFDKLGIKLFTVNQMPDTLPEELKSYGGKRPDFVVDTDVEKLVAVIDAKYHQTNNLSDFSLTNEELKKYSGLKSFLMDLSGEAEVLVIFMVFPKESTGSKYTLIELEQMLVGQDSELGGEGAKKINIKDDLFEFGTDNLAP